MTTTSTARTPSPEVGRRALTGPPLPAWVPSMTEQRLAVREALLVGVERAPLERLLGDFAANVSAPDRTSTAIGHAFPGPRRRTDLRPIAIVRRVGFVEARITRSGGEPRSLSRDRPSHGDRPNADLIPVDRNVPGSVCHERS